MGKKKKASKAPKLVAPEPAGDEWEATMAWDRVAASGAPPAFFNGTHLAATENVFNVRYDVAQPAVASAALTSSNSQRCDPERQRALDVYLRAETQLHQSRVQQKESQEAVDGFRTLELAERQHTAKEKARLEEEWAAALRRLDENEMATVEQMEALSDTFFNLVDAAKNRIFDLLAKDSEVEGAFEERRATLRECEEVTDAYYTEHAAHVHSMKQLQDDMAKEHADELERMTRTLQDMAFELLVMASQQDNTADVQQRRTELLSELKTLHKQTPETLRAQEDAACGTEALQRLVDLEEQKLALAQRRQLSLRRAVHALSELPETEVNTGKSAEASALTVVTRTPTVNEDPLNEIAALRRALDETNAELAAAEEKLRHLENYHLVQLSGAYKPISAVDVDVGIQGTANSLDPEIKAAIRAVVIRSMRSLSASAHAAQYGLIVDADDDDVEFLVPPVETIEDRLAVQRYVVHQINLLLSGELPTAPPLTLLSSTPSPAEEGRETVC